MHESGIDADFLVDVESCVTPADDAMIIYTSGSTGDPKAPVHTQGTLVRHTYNLTFDYGVTHDTVMFTAMPFFWVGGLITGVHAVIHHGATLVTQPAFDAAEALELIERYRATITLGWPQQGKTLAEHPDFAHRDLSSVQRTSMPAMVPPERRPQGPNALGMTELCGNHIGVDPYPPQPPDRAETGGRSVEGLSHVLVDPDTGNPVPVGTDGEIWVRGYSLMQRLYKREREEVFTAGRLLPDRRLRCRVRRRLDQVHWPVGRSDQDRRRHQCHSVRSRTRADELRRCARGVRGRRRRRRQRHGRRRSGGAAR